MSSVFTNGAFTPPGLRQEPVVINSHMFQDSFGALPGRTNGVGGSATVHARQALELGDKGVMVAPAGDPALTLKDITLPAAAYGFHGESKERHDDWYEPGNKAFLVEQVLGTITGRNDIIYAHMPISGQVALEHVQQHNNPLVYLGHAWEIISATFFPSRDLKVERLLSEYAIISHLAKKGGGIIVTNSKWEADTIAEAYSQPPTERHLREFMLRCTGAELTAQQERQISIACGCAGRNFQALGALPSKDQIRGLCVPNPIGVDTNDFNPTRRAHLRQLRRIELLKNLNIDGDAVVIGSVGRIHPQKDPMESIRVFHKAYDILGSNRPKMHLLLAGPGEVNQTTGEPKGYFKDVEEYLQTKHGEIRHLVHIPGRQECPVTINSLLDVRLDTAEFETWGLSLQEALAMGVPSVARSNPVYTELYKGTGMVVEESTEGLATSLAKLAISADDRESYGQTCEKIGSRYDWTDSVEKLGKNVLSKLGVDLNLRSGSKNN
jgi:glycosyltransferase involved in cell wall biosynthesis